VPVSTAMMPRATKARPSSCSDVNLGKFPIKPNDRHGPRDCNSYLMTSRRLPLVEWIGGAKSAVT
jgi:hypothetical protein